MTNMIITPDQTQGTCPEDPELSDVKCINDSDCTAMEPVKYGHGKLFHKQRCKPKMIKILELSNFETSQPKSSIPPIQPFQRFSPEIVTNWRHLVCNNDYYVLSALSFISGTFAASNMIVYCVVPKISIPPPRRELEIPKGRRLKDPRNSGGVGVGWSIYFPDVLRSFPYRFNLAVQKSFLTY